MAKDPCHNYVGTSANLLDSLLSNFAAIEPSAFTFVFNNYNFKV